MCGKKYYCFMANSTVHNIGLAPCLSFLRPCDMMPKFMYEMYYLTMGDKILIAETNNLLKPRTYTKYVAWGFPDRSLRFISYEQEKLLSKHENLHGGNQIQCASVSHDGYS